MVEVSLTVGKLDASLALLLTKEHHLIEFPTVLLPDGVSAGSVVTIKCEQNYDLEREEARQFEAVQEEILQLFGTHEPKTPNLHIKNVTQTSAVLEWDPLELGSASIKSLTLYKNGTRLGQIPNPLSNTTTKLSGLPVDTKYDFHLRLDTTAGVYVSERVNVHTHKMTDLSGITVCIGDIDPSEGITRKDIERSLASIGSKPLQTEVAVDTTHFVATVGLGSQWKKALDSNIPVVRPEWLKACEQERRIVGVKNFYLDADPKFLEQHKFEKYVVNKPDQPEEVAVVPAETTTVDTRTVEETPVVTEETTLEESKPKEAVAEPVAESIDETPVTTETKDGLVEETPLAKEEAQAEPIIEVETLDEIPIEEETKEATTVEEVGSTPVEEEASTVEVSEIEVDVEEPVEDPVEQPVIQETAEVKVPEEAQQEVTIEEPVEENIDDQSAIVEEPLEVTVESVVEEPEVGVKETNEDFIATEDPVAEAETVDEPIVTEETFDDVDINDAVDTNEASGTTEESDEDDNESKEEEITPTTAEPKTSPKQQTKGGKSKSKKNKKKARK